MIYQLNIIYNNNIPCKITVKFIKSLTSKAETSNSIYLLEAIVNFKNSETLES